MAKGKIAKVGYAEVDDDRRRPIRHPARLSRIAEELMTGKTLLIASDGRVGIPRQSLAKRGFKVHTRKDTDGMVVWATVADPDGGLSSISESVEGIIATAYQEPEGEPEVAEG